MIDNNRVIAACDELIRNGFAKSYSYIAKTCGKSTQYFTDIKSGKSSFSLEFVGDLLKNFKMINPSFLINGEGPVINPGQINYDGKGIPFYNIDVTATITTSFDDVKEIPEFYVDFKPFNDCTAYLPVYGDSMYPRFANGEIVVVKEVRNKDAILWGEAYLVITNSEWNSLRTIKQVHQHEDYRYVTLRASNPNYKGELVIPKDAILSMYFIVGKVVRIGM
jgi:hypothetical protein